MVVDSFFDRNKERGKELKVPHHARATLARDGNMPGVTAACLIPDTKYFKKQDNYAIINKDVSILNIAFLLYHIFKASNATSFNKRL